jgi:predicted ATPase
MNTTLITGNTYPVKDQLRALGGIWNKRLSGWLVPDERAKEARALVDCAPTTTRRTYTPRVVYARFSSGATIYQNRRGRCEDAPCCGCCS